jgi:putative hydrolase of the HAD superfamily
MAHPGVVVLDIDDTLYLERDYVRSGLRAVSEWATAGLGLSGVFDRAWSAFECGHRGDLFDRALRSLGHAPDGEIVARMVAIYRQHEPAIALADDARRFLAGNGAGRDIAVVSDGPLESQRTKARALGLERWAEPIILTAAYGKEYSKPSPLAFRFIQDRFAVDARACWYIADNPAKDFGGPRSLGWHTVRISRPGGLHYGDKSGSDIELEIDTMDRLPRLIAPKH